MIIILLLRSLVAWRSLRTERAIDRLRFQELTSQHDGVFDRVIDRGEMAFDQVRVKGLVAARGGSESEASAQ